MEFLLSDRISWDIGLFQPSDLHWSTGSSWVLSLLGFGVLSSITTYFYRELPHVILEPSKSQDLQPTGQTYRKTSSICSSPKASNMYTHTHTRTRACAHTHFFCFSGKPSLIHLIFKLVSYFVFRLIPYLSLIWLDLLNNPIKINGFTAQSERTIFLGSQGTIEECEEKMLYVCPTFFPTKCKMPGGPMSFSTLLISCNFSFHLYLSRK